MEHNQRTEQDGSVAGEATATQTPTGADPISGSSRPATSGAETIWTRRKGWGRPAWACGFLIAFAWIALIYFRSLGTYGWQYDEPFYSAEALDFYTQLVPMGPKGPASVSVFTAITGMIKRLPDVTMVGWSFDSGLPVARALVGVPLLLFKFDPVWSRVPYAAVTLLALFYMARYMRLITGFFGREEGGSHGSEGVRNVSLIATMLLIAVSPTCFFQAHFVVPQTVSFLLLAMACHALAKGFIDRRASQTIRAMVLFLAAIILNYQNLLLAPFVVFNLLFFGLAYERKVEASSAFVVFGGLLGALVVFCRDYLISSFGLNVTGHHGGNTGSVPADDRIGRLCERLGALVSLLGVPSTLAIAGCLLAAGFGLAWGHRTVGRSRSRFLIYAFGTATSALAVPGLFMVSSNESSAAKYLIDVLLMTSPLFFMAVARIVALVTTSVSHKSLSPVRAFLNLALVVVALVATVSCQEKASLSRFAGNFEYEAVMRQWIPVLYAGRERGLVFGSDWYQHTFAFTGGGMELFRDFAYVPAWQLPDRPEGRYSAIRLVDDPSKDYWTDQALTFAQFDYARFLRERDRRLDSLKPFMFSGTLVVLGGFVALNGFACVRFRRKAALIDAFTSAQTRAEHGAHTAL